MSEAEKTQRSNPDTWKEPPFYPRHRVIGIINDKASVDTAVKALQDAGFAEDTIAVFTGEEAVQKVDPECELHGMKWRIIRGIQQLGEEASVLKSFKVAWQAGHYTVSLPGETPEIRKEPHQILKAHNAYNLHHFSRWAVEDLV